MSSMLDIASLECQGSYLETLCSYAGPKLRKVIEALVDYSETPQRFEILGKSTFKWVDLGSLRPRKLSLLQDHEGKTRTIGVVDY